jgi:hypothetical protein
LFVPSQAITAVAAKNGVFGAATEEIESVPFCFSLLFVIYLCFLFNLPSVISLFFLPDCVLCVCPSAQGGGATGDEAGVRMLAGQCSSPLLSRFLLQFFPGFFLLLFSSLSVPFPHIFFLLLRSLIFSGFIAREYQPFETASKPLLPETAPEEEGEEGDEQLLKTVPFVRWQ